MAELLKDHGVSVRVVTTLQDAASATGADTTLLVTAPNLLTPHQQTTLRAATTATAGRTVLLGAGPSSVGTLAPGVRAEPSTSVVARPPGCSMAAALRAGAVETGGIRYASDGLDATACYPAAGLPSVLLLRQPASGDTVLLGSPDFLYNERLDHQGNASLALQLLGSRPHLVWYLPSLTDPSAGGTTDDDGATNGDTVDGESSFVELINVRLAMGHPATRTRRRPRRDLAGPAPGPPRHRTPAGGHPGLRVHRGPGPAQPQGQHTRQGRRLTPPRHPHPRGAPRGRLPARRPPPAVLLPALSARLGHAHGSVSDLLFGPAPSEDAALVLLADQLDSLEREVRTS
ncbi:DUF4350 domain-containing protein [Streptomyces sp. A1277]|uniref:DUF4350 domain-containing protein n=1 Tax=Streptomyces sp. A1277 TaxID=2563103 RepID=UPI001F10482E|nr:DUF4350 domain-containing protein [Streptomyces sp. A1277]